MTTALIFDTETTDKDEPELIEVAWLRIRSEHDEMTQTFVIHDCFCERFMPQKRISYGAMAVHHILPSELEDREPSSSFTLPDEVDYLVGHNIDFDWRVIGEPDVRRICTDAMSRHVWPDADAYSQSALIYYLLGPTEETRTRLKDAHSALADVHNAAALLEKIVQARVDLDTWAKLYAYSEFCRIPLVMPFGKRRDWTLERMASEDFSYCQWLLNQDWVDPYLAKGVEMALNGEKHEFAA